MLTPAWPNGASSVMMANAAVRQVPHPLAGERYGVDFDALEAAVSPRTRLLVYTSPSNPLGWVATEEEQRRLLDFARRHGLWLLADEVYDRLFYAGARLGDPAPSILRMATRDDAVMVVHSFSKSYCMTGWRVGWLVARRDLAAKATQLNEFIVSHAPSFAQKAGETALAEGEGPLVEMLERLRGEPRSLPGCARRHPRRDGPQARRRVLPVPAHRGLGRFLRLLQAPARRDQGRSGARRGLRRRRRGLGPDLLCRRAFHSGTRHGAPDEVPAR